MREVVRAVLSGIPRHSPVVELLDPFGRVRKSSPDGDGECWESPVLDVPVGRLGEGVNIPDETGLKELDCLFTVIQLLLVVCFLGGEVLVVAVSAGLGGDDEPVDDRAIGVRREVVAGN